MADHFIRNEHDRQRLNMLWAMPLTIALWPFRYVLNGDGGWSTKTRMGRFILRVTGHLKDAEDAERGR